MGELLSSALLSHSVNGHLTGIAAADLTFTGNAELSGSSGASGVNFADLDVSDPESLFAFFSAQMTEAKGDVASMMQDQQARNDKIRRLQTASATLSKWEETGAPTDAAGHAAFVAAAKDVMAALPAGSKEAEAVGAILKNADGAEKTETFTEATQGESALGDAQILQAQHPGAQLETQQDAFGKAIYVVRYQETPPISKDEIKSVQANIKSYTDALATDNTMGMIRIQQGVERMSQITNLCSNVLKKHNDAQDSVITNLR